MRAVVCREWGPVDDLVVEERPSAPLGPGDVRLDVTACGVNYVEGLMVQGLYQVKIPAPFTPGMEVVGRVTEIGADVTDRRIGDRLFVNVGIGGYVDEVVVAATRGVPLPDGLSDGQAATFMQSYLTGWFALTQRVTTTPGQRMLVLGAGGGVGLAAVDIGTALGLEVYAAASSAEKLELARSRGAVALIDSSTDDVKARARELSGGGHRSAVRPCGRRSRRGVPAGPRGRGHLPRDRFRGWHPDASRQPDTAAEPTGRSASSGEAGPAATQSATTP